MSDVLKDEIRKEVREDYARIAEAESAWGSDASCCGPSESSAACCAPGAAATETDISKALGYSDEELGAVPEGANLGLGCGNPQAIASLKPGENVVDLGSGAGFDAFLAGKAVGDTGHVIGVDMTPAMISKARNNAEKAGTSNIEFRLGEIENIPVPDNFADVVISNCVINLSPDKGQVYKDAYRVLKPGGRVAISDVVAKAPFPDEVRNDPRMRSGCVSGAEPIDTIKQLLSDAGFTEIKVTAHGKSVEFIKEWIPGSRIEEMVVSAAIEAVKP